MSKSKKIAPKAPAAKVYDPRPTTGAEKAIPEAGGAEAKPEGAAAPASQAEAKAADAGIQSAAADPNGTAGAPAAQADESREQAASASSDQKGEDDEENEPEETALPPFAGIVVIGPKGGRWRSGMKFGPEPVVLDPEDFKPAEGEDPRPRGERLLAILTDPALRCFVRDEDGNDEPIPADEIELLRRSLDELADDAGD